MSLGNRIQFTELGISDLKLDAVYEGDVELRVKGDPIHKLLPGLGNVKGIRYMSMKKYDFGYCALVSSGVEVEWPDRLDVTTGTLTYYGDNREPGSELHDKDGNRYFREQFALLHSNKRKEIRPFFYFEKTTGRNYMFRGLAVPGAKNLSQKQDLVAVWNSKSGRRFQNYKAIFSILDIPSVSRLWLEDVRSGNPFSENCPEPYMKWVIHGTYDVIKSPESDKVRTKDQQLPSDPAEREMVEAIHEHFSGRPHDFEECAGKLFEMMDSNVVQWDVTRMSRDGGRDVIGKYRIGSFENGVEVDYALEAKCFAFSTGVGVKGSSRLISRIKNRQFGVLVTTSYLGRQPYKEIIEDGHPIIIMAASDIANLLKSRGFSSVDEVKIWLESEFNGAN